MGNNIDSSHFVGHLSLCFEVTMCHENQAVRRKLGLDSELHAAMVKGSQLLHGDDTIEEPAAAFQPKPCCVLGTCICQKERKDVGFFVANLMTHFRHIFANKKNTPTEARKQLDQYSVVIQLEHGMQSSCGQ